MKKLTDKEVEKLIEDHNDMIEYANFLEFKLRQEENLNRDHEQDYQEVWKLIKKPKESVVEAAKRLVKERDNLLKCLENLRCDGNGCFCDAQFAMDGAHPRHEEDCEKAIALINKIKYP